MSLGDIFSFETSFADVSSTDASYASATTTSDVLSIALPTVAGTPALTTLFIPPSSCLADTYYPSPEGSDTATVGNVIDITRGYEDACYPAGFSSLEGHFSPGICPFGYTGLGTEIGPYTTIVTCCPSSFDNYVTGGGDFSCMHYNASTAVISSDEPTTYTGVNLYALPIVIAYETTDLSILSAASTATPAQSAGSKASPTSNLSSSSGRSGLSTGAEAGIGVGVAVGVILILVGCLLFLRQRRKTKTMTDDEGNANAGDKPELSGEGKYYAEMDATNRKPEMGVDGAVHEVHGTANSGELDGRNMEGRAELEGGWQAHEAAAPQHTRSRGRRNV